ncbi:MAG: topoisomerase C-terminal repeat-containing protein, partial [Pirellulales bacterium]
PADKSPLDVTLDEALALLAQPKTRGRRAAKKEPLRVFDKSPVSGEPVQLLEGRYGPYVTDGTTNASLPKDVPSDEITFQQALDLLAERAARAPAKKKAKKKAAKKKAAKKKPAKRKAPKKKPATKKAVANKKAVKKKAGE